MKFTEPGIPPTRSVRQPVLLGLFCGLAVGCGFLLAGIPNLELMTLVVAMSGVALGAPLGVVCGVVSAIIYSMGSPYGQPLPLMLAAQAAGLGFVGAAGYWGSQLVRKLGAGSRLATIWICGATGLAGTLVYDLLTNLAIIFSFDTPALVVLAGAVPFLLVHVGTNTFIFAALLPSLLSRLNHLGKTPLRGSTGTNLPILVLLGLWTTVSAVGTGEARAQEQPEDQDQRTAAVADTLVILDQGPFQAHGWRRPLWRPFAPTQILWLGWYSPWVPVTDGGLGAMTAVIGEATTDYAPTVVRNGVPVGTGHVLADDPAMNLTAAYDTRTGSFGPNQWGGTGGEIRQTTLDATPDRAYSEYRGVKGNHETYYRSIRLLTPSSAWRAGFEFEESLDNEGYNFTDQPDEVFRASSTAEFPGAGKIRQSETRIIRQFDDRNRLTIAYANGRKTKDSLPTLSAEHMEIWDDGVTVGMVAGGDSWAFDGRVFWKNRDVQWGDLGNSTAPSTDVRLLETGREGFQADLRSAGGPSEAGGGLELGLTFRLDSWSVADTGPWEAWAGADTLPISGRGQQILGGGLLDWRGGTARLKGLAGVLDAQQGGTGPHVDLAVSQDDDQPWWKAEFFYGGRAPRSDELLSPIRYDVAGRELVVLPTASLDREKTVRGALALQGRVLGFDLALDGSYRTLKDGIVWSPEAGDPDRGAWSNGLSMNASRLAGRIGLGGPFLGWARIMAEGVLQDFDEKAGRANRLPPEQYLRLHVMWENHFFQEDGILQVALYTTRVGEMSDPWDVTRTSILPARTFQDLLIGFRLVGANLSVAVRNLTGDKIPLTSNSLSPARELDLRLAWTFLF